MFSQPSDPSKQVRNVLTEWLPFNSHRGLRIRGKVMVDQPTAGVKSGEVIVTSPVERWFRVDNTLHVETANSLYILM